MPKKKVITKKNIKKTLKKKVKVSRKNNKSLSNPLDLIHKENESQLISLITKEFDKELASKAKTSVSYTHLTLPTMS